MAEAHLPGGWRKNRAKTNAWPRYRGAIRCAVATQIDSQGGAAIAPPRPAAIDLAGDGFARDRDLLACLVVPCRGWAVAAASTGAIDWLGSDEFMAGLSGWPATGVQTTG